jgi:hypothetical protein
MLGQAGALAVVMVLGGHLGPSKWVRVQRGGVQRMARWPRWARPGGSRTGSGWRGRRSRRRR